MNNDNDEVQELIRQLKSLQLQQTVLLTRLERARNTEARRDTADDTRVDVNETTREFAIGDRVRIKNPNRFQADRGTITKIGASRITVQTRSGAKITRAPKNLIIDDG
jgi:hypothetical protein